MATINLDVQTIQSINSEISSLDTTLLNNYLPELESELNAINSNVQGDQIHSIIGNINQQFASVKSSLSTEFPKLENFLETQMTSYSQNEDELDSELVAVLQKMALLSGEGIKNFNTNGNSLNGSTLSSANVSSTTQTTSSKDNNGSDLAGKVKSGAVTGAVLGGVGMATGVATTMLVGTKLGAALGSCTIPGVGTAVGAAAGALIGAAAPVVINGVGKGLEAVGGWLDSIY